MAEKHKLVACPLMWAGFIAFFVLSDVINIVAFQIFHLLDMLASWHAGCGTLDLYHGQESF